MKKIIAIICLLAIVFLVACEQQIEEKEQTLLPITNVVEVGGEGEAEEEIGMANPASVYCVKQGYDLEIRDEADGQVGYCVFQEGVECEEWLFYRGVCGDKYRKDVVEE